jgi:Leucine-rich repeat (LRR) protein
MTVINTKKISVEKIENSSRNDRNDNAKSSKGINGRQIEKLLNSNSNKKVLSIALIIVGVAALYIGIAGGICLALSASFVLPLIAKIGLEWATVTCICTTALGSLSFFAGISSLRKMSTESEKSLQDSTIVNVEKNPKTKTSVRRLTPPSPRSRFVLPSPNPKSSKPTIRRFSPILDARRPTERLDPRTFLTYPLKKTKKVTFNFGTYIKEKESSNSPEFILGPHILDNMIDDKGKSVKTELSDEIGKLTQLQVISIRQNKNIPKIPESIGNLIKLRRLRYTENALIFLPHTIGELKSLEELDVAFNKLTFLPDSITNLKSLTDLRVTENQITFLPEAIGNLTSLRYLNLYGNKLETLPDSMRKLSNLEILYIANNPLNKIPGWINDLPRLKTLYINTEQGYLLPKDLDRNRIEVVNLDIKPRRSNDYDSTP